MKRLLALILFGILSIAAGAQTKIVIFTTPAKGADSDVQYSFYLYPPAANQKFYRQPNGQPSGNVATAQEITDYKNGVFIEEPGAFQVPSGWTNAQIRTELQNRYTARDTTFQAEQAKWNRYGSVWDGTTWTTRVIP